MKSTNQMNIVKTICISLIASFTLSATTAKALELDLSRRQVDFNKVSDEDRLPIKKVEESSFQFIDKVFEDIEPAQDIVIMNTDKGFVPEMLNLKKGGNYRLHVVNVNNRQKNVSFILDAFSEHHSTLFGEQKTFLVSPKTEGVFSFQCPETAVQGKVVVTTAATTDRKPASK